MNASDYYQYLLALESRKILSKDERNNLLTYYNGKEGERYFKSFLNTIPNVTYIYNFEFGNQHHVQIDYLVATDNTLFLFEIKHYRDEWHFEQDYLKNSYGLTTKSPIKQTQFMKSELEKLLHQNGIHIDIQPYIIFTNPHFIPVGNWPHNQNIIYFNQLNQIKEILQSYTSKFNPAILNFLLQHKKIHSTYYQKEITPYFDLSLAGIKCPSCRKMHTINIVESKIYYNCTYCYSKIKSEEIVLYNLKELYYLKRDGFTFDEAIQWCYPVKQYTIGRVCNKYFKSEKKRNRKFSPK
ncbi:MULTISPECIES: nuclease-related domain-containing protein [unclassified Mammaliicoccus]|uniref:nuclease-related domain-containing protein n=1 Tax=unclassified Mammaliicoccus TaxID=2803851 RepID=UPI001EFB72FC|nr:MULTISPECIES: nuclease-related domain-containing protein [unclassified Mammaliicoccus]